MSKGDAGPRIESVCRRLRQAGHRITSQRLAIIEFLFSSTEHPTVKRIHEALQHRFPTMSLMTVYQTVRLLTSMSEVGIASTQSEHTHYEGLQPESHPHLVCRRCGIVVDAGRPCAANELPQPEPQGWQIHRWHLEWIGLCPDCQRVTTDSSSERKEVAGREE